MLKIASLGTCLSGIPAAFMQELGATRFNNVMMPRSDHFVDYFIRQSRVLPDYHVLSDMLAISAHQKSADFASWLAENYRDRCGLRHIDAQNGPLLQNLLYQRFDVFLLDNLGDITTRLVQHDNADLGSFTFNFPVGESARVKEFWPHCKYTSLLTPEESVENWIEIIGFLKTIQPHAKIVFLCAHYDNSPDDPERQQRARSFFHLFASRMAHSSIQIVPPIALPTSLYKLPDKDHFEISVYRGLAGQIYLNNVATFAEMPAGGRPVPVPPPPSAPAPTPAVSAEVPVSAEPPAAPEGKRTYGRGPAATELRSVPLSLTGTVADFLKLPPDAVTEESGADATDGWDSLNQLNVVAHVERAFGIQFAFDDTTDAKTIRALREVLRHLGIVASDDPGSPLDASAAPPSEPTSTTEAPPVAGAEGNLFADFAARAVRAPDERFALFVSRGTERPLTCAWVLRHALGAARRLDHLPRGTVVGIVLPHSEHLYTTFIGCALAGLVPTILPPLTSKQDPAVFQRAMDVLFERVRPGAVFTTGALSATLPASVPVLLVEEIEPSAAETLAADVAALPAVDPAATAFLQHSSGTTGHKKGVMLGHDKVRRHLAAYADSIGLVPGDAVATWLPLYHDMGLITSFLMPAVMGGSIVSLDALEWVTNPTLLLHQIERTRAAFTWLPNFAFHHIVRADDGTKTFDLSSLRGVISCSEPARGASFDAFAARYEAMGCGRSKLGVSYAMAENVFAVTQTRLGGEPTPRDPDSPYLSSGPLLPGIEVEIRREDGASGEVGAIFLRGPYLFDGYHHQPELTAERMRDGWYDTRDVGRMIDGQLYVYGRTDDMLIVNGRNVVAHEVEDEITQVPGVAPGRVLLCTPYDPTVGSGRLSVLAEAVEDTDEAALKARLRDRVLALCGLAPTYVVILPRGFLIKSTSGKIARTESQRKWLESDLGPSLGA